MKVQNISANHYQKNNKYNQVAFGMTVDIMSQKELLIKYIGEDAFKTLRKFFQRLNLSNNMKYIFKKIAESKFGLTDFDPEKAIPDYNKAVIRPAFKETSSGLELDGFDDGSRTPSPCLHRINYSSNFNTKPFSDSFDEFVGEKIKKCIASE